MVGITCILPVLAGQNRQQAEKVIEAGLGRGKPSQGGKRASTLLATMNSRLFEKSEVFKTDAMPRDWKAARGNPWNWH